MSEFDSEISDRQNSPADRKLCRFVCYLLIAVSTGFMLAAICRVKPLLSANDRSRWCTVWSIVERGTYQIDEIIQERGWNTIDKVSYQQHFYSTKPTLLPTLVAGVYAVVRKTTGWNLLDDTEFVTRLILVLINLVPMVIAWVVIARLVERYARTNLSKIYIVSAATMGTFLTTFLVTLNNHSVAAMAVIFALYPTMRILIDGSQKPKHFLLAGFFAAFASTNELPAASFGLLLFVMVCRKAPKETLRLFIPVAIVPVAALLITTYIGTGRWTPFYLDFGTATYEEFHDGSPSYWKNPKGIDKGGDAPATYLLHCTLGHHGIFSLSPIFLLTAATWMRFRRWKSSSLAPVLWQGLILTAVVLGFYLSRTANYNYGGHTCGLRWAFWLIPFWLVAMIPVTDEYEERCGFRILAVLFLCVSVFSAMWAIDKPWQHPWLFQLMEQWGWIDYS